MTLKKLSRSVLFCVLLVLSSVCFSQEASVDFWEQQRVFYLRYPVWELPAETIVEWLNQLEQSEKDSMMAQAESSEASSGLREALSILNPLKGELEQVSKLLEMQQNQLVLQSTLIWIGIAVTTALFLIK